MGAVSLEGCNATPAPCTPSQPDKLQQLSDLKRQKDDTLYEIQLRQGELDQMMATTKGAVGVSHEWLERKSQLTEQITQLQVKAHDLDLQMNAL
jgi:hypothetical protein